MISTISIDCPPSPKIKMESTSSNENNGSDDLLAPILVCKDKGEMLPCSKIVVPTSMRSSYWRYFGFPADAHNNVLTRSRIVCCLCRAYLVYNKNTTNLSNHLRAKHPSIYSSRRKNSVETAAAAGPRKRSKAKAAGSTEFVIRMDEDELEQTNYGHPTGIGMKGVIGNPTASEVKLGDAQVSGDELIEILEYDSKVYLEMAEEQNLSGDEATETIHPDFFGEEYLTSNNLDVEHSDPMDTQYEGGDNEEFEREDLNRGSEECQKTNDEQALTAKFRAKSLSLKMCDEIQSFLIKDILSPSIVEGEGFRRFVRNISKEQQSDLPSAAQVISNYLPISRLDSDLNSRPQIESSISKCSEAAFSSAFSQLAKAQNDGYVSLALEKCSNNKGDDFVLVSVRYVEKQRSEKTENVKRILLDVIEFENLGSFLEGGRICWPKCASVISNWHSLETDHFRKFFSDKSEDSMKQPKKYPTKSLYFESIFRYSCVRELLGDN